LPLDKEKRLALAQKYLLKGQSKKAIEEYNKLIEADPKDKRLYLKVGDLYQKIGDNERAIKVFMKLAEIYAKEDLNSRAISIYKKILSINPKHIDALRQTGNLYLKNGLIGNAKNFYQSILKIKPDDWEAQEALNSLSKHAHQVESTSAEKSKMMASFEPATFEPTPFVEPTAHIEPTARLEPTAMIEPAANTEPVSEPITEPVAEPFFESIAETTPSAPPPAFLQPEEITFLDETPEIPPSSIEAQTIPEAAGAPAPDKEAETHYQLGIAYMEMELYDYAINEFMTASSDSTIKFDCEIMLGSCYLAKGDYPKAIHHLTEASYIKNLSDEKLAKLNFHLGLAYEAMGLYSEALDYFKLVLTLDSSNSEAQEKINKLQS